MCYNDNHYLFIQSEQNDIIFTWLFFSYLFVYSITVTCRDDGTYHPNFKPMKVDADFSVARYASNVANELLWALEGLVKNSE